MSLSLQEELRMVEASTENAKRFTDVDGGLHHRSRLFDHKKIVLQKLMEKLPKFEQEKPDEYTEKELQDILKRIEYEEQYLSVCKVAKEYDAMKVQWKSWYEQSCFEMEKDFEETLAYARGIDNILTKGYILQFEQDKEMTQEKRLLFYLAMKTSVLRYREARKKYPPKIMEPLIKENSEETAGENKTEEAPESEIKS